MLFGSVLGGLESADAPTAVPDAANTVYRDAAPGSVEELPPPRRMVVLPGRVRSDRARASEIEALLRLHVALGLRDVHAGPVVLSWAPAGADELDDGLCARPGPLDPALAPWLESGDRPDPLGRPAEVHDDLRVALQVELLDEGIQLELIGCSARSDRFSQVVEGRLDQLDIHLAELLTWLAARVGVEDARAFEEAWRRLPAFGGPAGRAYGRALAGSQGGALHPDLIDASALGAEAAWLRAWLGSEDDRLATLLRATELRWSFTAAVEDAAWAHAERGRPDLARAVLERLAPADERTRPVELALAAGLLDRGAYRPARALVDRLPPRWNRTDAAARLQTRLALGLGDSAAAQAWLEAWIEADPESGEAWLMRGDVLASEGELKPARKAWARAAELDEEQWPRATARLAAQALDAGRPDTFAKLLDDRDDALGPAPDWLVELDAWMALQAGSFDRALQGYSSLLEAGPDRIRLNTCVAALHAGRGKGEPACEPPAGTEWQRSRLQLALKSREPGLLPGYPPILDTEVEEQLDLAPRHPAALQAAWTVLGPHATPDERDALAARWRVAHGAGAELPTLAWIKDEE